MRRWFLVLAVLLLLVGLALATAAYGKEIEAMGAGSKGLEGPFSSAGQAGSTLRARGW